MSPCNRLRTVGLRVSITACTLLALACGHAARTQEARTALDAGDPKRALELYNEELEVSSAKELPAEPGGDDTLLVLDRSMILQQLTDHELSARDLEYADKQIELLDFTRSTTDDISRYVFSDDSGPYKAPPYEKLMINTMNMVNYLAMGDLNGARVEARRFTVMQDYLHQTESSQASMLGAGSYLAGFVFEHSGQADAAMRYYDEALQYGEFETLAAPVARLAARSSYRTERLTALLKGAAPPENDDGTAEVLVVLGSGRVPAKVALRLPIGLALTRASDSIRYEDAQRANALAAQGLVTWINFPTLPKPKGRYKQAGVTVDAETQPLEVVNVDDHAVAAWRSGEGAVIASAITRMITRVVAGQVAQKVGGDDGVGLLLSLATQATLTAADTPDTRSWATLPARLSLARFRVPAGKHVVRMTLGSKTVEKQLDLEPGGWAALNFTLLQ